MKQWHRIATAVVVVVLAAATVSRGDSNVRLKGIKCMICGMQVSAQYAVDYKGGKVFFGCGGCPSTFQRNVTKYAAAANAQLVATGQARQKACPVMGNPVKSNLAMKVGGVNVRFCCPRCKTALEGLRPEVQVQKVFNDKAFQRGFEPVRHRH